MKLLKDLVLIEVIDESETTSGGIYLPDGSREKPQKGKVLSVGQGVLSLNGVFLPLTVQVGDTVLFNKFAGTEIKDKTQRILSERDILAVLD